MSDSAITAVHQVNRHSVALCANKFLKFGLKAALGDLPRAGKLRRHQGAFELKATRAFTNHFAARDECCCHRLGAFALFQVPLLSTSASARNISARIEQVGYRERGSRDSNKYVQVPCRQSRAHH